MASGLALSAGAHSLVAGLDLNPLHWLGDAASEAVGDAWKAAMTALWSCGVWLLQLTFRLIDYFTTPDVSASGPLGSVLPYTMWIGASVALLMGTVQLGAALLHRDGKSIGRVLIGFGQFALVWAGYTGVAVVAIKAASGLTTGLLQALLHINSFAAFDNTSSFPREVNDTVVATALGLCTIFLILPAAIGYILIMLVREAAIMLLVATSPIAAGGLLAEASRAWFWKSLRWFIAALLVAPLAALVLGIGVKISQGIVADSGDQTAAAVGMAIVSCVLVLVGAVSPLVLFRLLAFVDPGTPSGAAARAAFDGAGGMSGLLGGGAGGGQGSGAATRQTAGGQSQGEAGAAAATAQRFSSGLAGLAGGGFGAVLGAAHSTIGSVVSKTTSVAADVMASTGVGHQAPHPYESAGSSGPGLTPGGRAVGDGDGYGATGSDRPPLPSPAPANVPGPPPAAGPAGGAGSVPLGGGPSGGAPVGTAGGAAESAAQAAPLAAL